MNEKAASACIEPECMYEGMVDTCCLFNCLERDQHSNETETLHNVKWSHAFEGCESAIQTDTVTLSFTCCQLCWCGGCALVYRHDVLKLSKTDIDLVS